MTSHKRESWGSKLGLIMAAAGSAIGLGAIWKLPYVMGQNGGGAFILLFILFNFLIGFPLFVGELLLGRQSQKGIVSTFRAFSEKDSAWALVGWVTAIISFLILGYYCVVAGWGLCYIVLALSDSFQGRTPEEIGKSFDVFRHSGSLNVLFQVMFLGLNAVILLKGLAQGIERWSKLMTGSLFVVLAGLALYAIQLKGFPAAAQYILYPDFSKLTPNGILQALSLALFTLSLAYGVMITYGSYTKADDDLPKTALLVVVANLVASVLIALTIFPMIFTFGFAPEAGEGLIFKTLPYVFEQLPGSMVISVVFFTLIIFAAITSSLSMFEVVVANFMDVLGISRRTSVYICMAVVFILGLPTAITGNFGLFPEWQQIFGESFMETCGLIIDWFLAIVALCTTLFIGYKVLPSVREQGFMTGTKLKFLYKPWLIFIRFFVPVAILLVILQRAGLLPLQHITG